MGGGIVGLAVARQLQRERPGEPVVVLEKEQQVGRHQTSHNSGVVHAGLYYPPGSLKARLCRRGVGLLQDYCAEQGLPYEQLGKLVVARDAGEEARLADLESRAHRNGVPGLRRLGPAGIQEIEPHVRGRAALHSPTTAVTDFGQVALRLAADVVAAGGQVRTGARVDAVRETVAGVEVVASGRRFGFGGLVVCGGLYGDRLAALVGAAREPAVVPFRGEYLEVAAARRHLVRGLVYPVPDPRLPFLGVHLTRHVDGTVSVGPNAVLALAREGYDRRDVSARDVADTLRWPGFWRLARTHWQTGLAELRGSLSPRRFADEVRRFVPELSAADLSRGPAGVRAQAVDRRGGLVEDFVIEVRGRVALVRNAPSPAATASLAIAEHVCQQVAGGLRRPA